MRRLIASKVGGKGGILKARSRRARLFDLKRDHSKPRHDTAVQVDGFAVCVSEGRLLQLAAGDHALSLLVENPLLRDVGAAVWPFALEAVEPRDRALALGAAVGQRPDLFRDLLEGVGPAVQEELAGLRRRLQLEAYHGLHSLRVGVLAKP